MCYTPNMNCRRSIYGHGSYYLVCDWSCFRISEGQRVRPSHSSRRPGTNSSNINTNLAKRDLATKYFGDHLFSLPVPFTGSESVTSTNRTRRKRWLILSIRGVCNYRWLYGIPANLYGRHTISGKVFTFAILYLHFCKYHVPQNCKLWDTVWDILQLMTRSSWSHSPRNFGHLSEKFLGHSVLDRLFADSPFRPTISQRITAEDDFQQKKLRAMANSEVSIQCIAWSFNFIFKVRVIRVQRRKRFQ